MPKADLINNTKDRKMKNCALFTIVVAGLVAPAAAQAVSVQSTTSVFVSLRQCVSGETACDSVGPSHRASVGGMPGSPVAKAVESDPDFGEASGIAQLKSEPGTGNTTMHVKSLPATRNGSTAFTLQRYTNTSERAQTLTFTGDVSYDQAVPEENSSFPKDGGGLSGVFIEMELFSLEADSIEAGTTAEDNFRLFDKPPPGYQTLDNASTNGLISDVTGQGERRLSTSTTLEPGDSIWMFTVVQTIAANGAVVEAKLETKLDRQTE